MIDKYDLVVANILSEKDDSLRAAIADPEGEVALDVGSKELLLAIAEVRDRLIGQQALVAISELEKE